MDWRLIKNQWNDFVRRVQQRYDELIEYFYSIPGDEDIAWSAIGIGVLLLLIGLFTL